MVSSFTNNGKEMKRWCYAVEVDAVRCRFAVRTVDRVVESSRPLPMDSDSHPQRKRSVYKHGVSRWMAVCNDTVNAVTLRDVSPCRSDIFHCERQARHSSSIRDSAR